MHCTLCYTELAPSRNKTGVQFCCDEHRKEWESIHGKLVLLAPAQPLKAPTPALRSGCSPAEPPPYETSLWPALPLAKSPQLRLGEIRACDQLFPLLLFPEKQLLPPPVPAPVREIAFARQNQIYRGIVSEARPVEDVSPPEFLRHSGGVASGSWSWLRQVWRQSPSDLKVMTIALPLFALLAMAPALPKVRVKVPEVAQQQKGVQKVFAQQWETVRTR